MVADLGLVKLGVVVNLLVRVTKRTLEPELAGVREGLEVGLVLDLLAHFRLVAVDGGVPPEPPVVVSGVSEGAALAFVGVSLLAPRGSELGEVALADPSALLIPDLVRSDDEGLVKVVGGCHEIGVVRRRRGVRPAAVEKLPVLGGHLQIIAHCNVADELVVAVKDVGGGPDVVIETEQHCVAVGCVHVRVVPVVHDLDRLEALLEALPRGRKVVEEVRIVQGRIREVLRKLLRGSLVETVGLGDDVVEAAVEDDLHATIDLGAGDLVGLNLGRDDVVNVCLELLPGEVTLPATQGVPNEPGDDGNCPGSVDLIEAGLGEERAAARSGRRC